MNFKLSILSFALIVSSSFFLYADFSGDLNSYYQETVQKARNLAKKYPHDICVRCGAVAPCPQTLSQEFLTIQNPVQKPIPGYPNSCTVYTKGSPMPPAAPPIRTKRSGQASTRS